MAENDMIHRQADVVADLPSDDVIVPGQDLHLHTTGLQSGNGRSGGLLRRVEERDIAKQCEAGLVRDGIRCLRWRHLFESDRDHPKSVRVKLGRRLLSLGEVALIEGAGLAVDRIGLASSEDLFDGSFADENVGVVTSLENDRHPAPFKVEWNLVDLAEALVYLQLLVEFDMFEDCDIEQVLETGLVETVQISIFKDSLRVGAPDIKMALEDNTILRERAGLVRAQHVHCPEVLDRVEALDDDLLLRHRHGTLGQIDRHDHRQHLWRESHRHGDREQQRLEPIALGQAVDHEHKRGHHHDETEHQPGKPGDALVEAREYALLGDRARHLTKSRLAASEHDDPGADAADDSTAHEADVRQIERRLRGPDVGSSDLLERHRLAGQRRLVDEEVVRCNQPDVGGNHVAGRQQHDIAGHELLDRDFVMLFRGARYVPTHARGDPHHPSQRGGGHVRTVFLDETQ